ncbi:short chain dehydrogenase/ reductase [Xylariales sp. PMI_506]|nr:short chain dehydrogenase/ reductase [Xylariales sp. PMI_506]
MAPPTTTPFAGKVILITGGASGIGETAAVYLAARGASLSLSDVAGDNLESVVQRIKEESPDAQVLTQVVDVTNSQQVEDWVVASKEKFGKIDGCVNSAGISGRRAPIQETSAEIWDRIIGVNQTGVFNSLRSELAHMADGGSIVNLASVLGLHGMSGFSPYVASKHAVIGLTKVAAIENAGRRIRVNAVCPTFVNTPMVYGVRREFLEAGRPAPEFVGNLPQLFRELVDPEDIASIIAFLLGDESRFITKSIYEVSAGFHN